MYLTGVQGEHPKYEPQYQSIRLQTCHWPILLSVPTNATTTPACITRRAVPPAYSGDLLVAILRPWALCLVAQWTALVKYDFAARLLVGIQKYRTAHAAETCSTIGKTRGDRYKVSPQSFSTLLFWAANDF